MSYLTEVAADSPVLWWKCDEAPGATTAADASGHSNTGTLQRGVTSGSLASIVGVPGTTAYTGGGDPEVDADAVAGLSSGASAFTQEGWFYLAANNTPPAFDNTAVVVGAGGSNWAGVFLYDDGDGLGNGAIQGQFQYSATNSTLNHTLSGALAPGWHHVAMRWDGTTRTLFHNGAAAGSDTPSAPTVVPTAGTSYANTFTGGRLAHVAIYASALSDARILAHYTAGITVPPVTYTVSLAGTVTPAGAAAASRIAGHPPAWAPWALPTRGRTRIRLS